MASMLAKERAAEKQRLAAAQKRLAAEKERVARRKRAQLRRGILGREFLERGEDGSLLWHEGVDIPTEVRKVVRLPRACPECRCVGLSGGGQAVVCTSAREDVQYFRCRGCGHRWKLGVKEV